MRIATRLGTATVLVLVSLGYGVMAVADSDTAQTVAGGYLVVAITLVLLDTFVNRGSKDDE